MCILIQTSSSLQSLNRFSQLFPRSNVLYSPLSHTHMLVPNRRAVNKSQKKSINPNSCCFKIGLRVCRLQRLLLFEDNMTKILYIAAFLYMVEYILDMDHITQVHMHGISLDAYDEHTYKATTVHV